VSTSLAGLDRRAFLRRGVALGGGLVALGPLHALGAHVAMGAPLKRSPGYGPLVQKGDLLLPEGFNYQIISTQGTPQRDGTITAGIFDGMAAYRGRDGTTILIRNHENRRDDDEITVTVPAEFRYDQDPSYNAGNSKLRVRRHRDGFNPDRTPRYVYSVVESFNVLGGTDTNCAGGVVGRSWVTCEEVVNRSSVTGTKHGYCFEIPADTDGPVKARPILDAGRMVHEAVAWHAGILYETEDRNITSDARLGSIGSCFYRYIPRGFPTVDDEHRDDHGERTRRRPNLADTRGPLQALKLRGEFHANMDVGREIGRPYPVEWVSVDEPDHNDDTDNRRDRVPGFTPTRIQAQERGAAFFDRLEGAWVGDGKIYFDCTTGGAANFGQVWEYDPRRDVVTLIFESTSADTLENPDNVVIVPQTGDILLQEDSDGDQFLRGLTRDGEIYDFARTVTNDSEFCGGTFDPEGHTLYVNQQGGRPSPTAVTYAIYGPFDRKRR
jgi:secreted PhoX family phosphatase